MSCLRPSRRQPRGSRLVEPRIRLPIELMEQLEREARVVGLSLAAYIRRLLEARVKAT